MRYPPVKRFDPDQPLLEAGSSAPFLKYAKVDSFGAMRKATIGPFSPGLNVVFGRNEAGKSTLAAFIGGVLFGWEESRGWRNTYKPDDGERAGSLIFSTEECAPTLDGPPAAMGGMPGDATFGEHSECRLIEVSRSDNGGNPPSVHNLSPDHDTPPEHDRRRARNRHRGGDPRFTDGLPADASFTRDIDRDTYRTLFWLNGDELRTLRNTPNITAKLLSAGSGTSESPARALKRVQEQLAEFTSKSDHAKQSLVRLTGQRNRLRGQMEEAAAAMDRYRKLDQELHDLEPQRESMRQRIADLNREIESLLACKEGVEKLDAERSSLKAQRERLAKEERQADLDRQKLEEDIGRRLASLSGSEERTMRDTLESLEDRQGKMRSAVDMARRNLSASTAAFEVLSEASDEDTLQSDARKNRLVQILISTILPLFLIAGGFGIFVYGRSLDSLSYMALGLVFIVFALMLAAGALFLIFRPDKREDQRGNRLRDAQWVMLQDRKKLESCLADSEALNDDIRDELEEMGLEEAAGSLRRARNLLDEAREVRSDIALSLQRQQAAASRISDVDARIMEIDDQRSLLFRQADMEEDATAAQIQRELDHRMRQRAELLEISETVNARCGELRQELAAAREITDFDELKTRHQEVITRLNDSRNDFVRLLLAKRMLEAATASWESTSQPEVYRQAGKLMALMTGGRWTGVSLSPEGYLQVSDDAHTRRDPVRLSLGTCQQLYLSMRIALLMTADNVGRSIPIIADDILANFDSDRRRAAARALAELSRARQVILLTCHEEIVELMRDVTENTHIINLP